jgi:hypothetical protein
VRYDGERHTEGMRDITTPPCDGRRKGRMVAEG